MIELVVTMAIMVILALLVMKGIPFVKSRARDNRRQYELSNLQRVIEIYRTDNGIYPATPSGGGFVTYLTDGDAFAALQSPNQITNNYIPGVVPTYYQQLPVDPFPGVSTVSGCQALGYHRNIVYFSNGNHYKLVMHCSSETNDYDPDSRFFDPARPDWAWSISDDMNYTTFTLGW